LPRPSKSGPPKPSASKLVAPVSVPAAPNNLFTGTSGWAYPTWKPGFYPANVPSRTFLQTYASRLNSVEVNYTFRKLPTSAQLKLWLDATPPGFRFSFKAPQRITHFQRLRDSYAALAEFIAALAPIRKAGKLGPLLFQLPPNFKADNLRLSSFLKAPALKNKNLQLAFEFRHPGWFTEDTYAILRSRNAALCIAESGDLLTPEVHTANFVCYRLRCNGGYKPAQVKSFATRFAALAQQGEVFAYFKHEDAPTGPLNAVAMLSHAIKLAGAR
jgi:uncharacterized protein YecE (DUF72 family)